MTHVISKHESGKEASGWEEGDQHNGVRRTGEDRGGGEVNKNRPMGKCRDETHYVV